MGENIAGLNLVLLGKTGAGKSASGNTILGRQAFLSKKSPKSVTQEVSKQSDNVYGCPVTVYDTPGYFDTHLTEEEIQLKYQGIFQECESGPCVFLLVIKTDRFTEEEIKTVQRIEKLLGQNRLNKTWILFTGGDQLNEENMTIKEFINETEPLKKLVQKYNQRYHVFNNKKKLQKQVTLLITKFLAFFNTMGARINPLKRRLPKKAEQDTLDASLSSRRIVLLGKSGVGKSAAGNTILGQKAFKSVMSPSSVTSKCLEKHNIVSGRSVSVVDTPGFFDTQMKQDNLAVEIARSVYISSPGPHAFIFVFPVNMRITDQEQQIIQMIEMMFCEEVLKYSIILFTHGDLLRGKPIEKLIEENSRLRDLVDQCGGRFHVFNNRDENNRDQVNDLLQKIDTMIEQNGRGHYSNEMLEDALRFRREEEVRRRREEEEMREREEEERKQQEEKQRQDEEKRRQEIETRMRAEFEAQLKSEQERLVTRQREDEDRKQHEKKRRDENEREIKVIGDQIRAEMEAKLKQRKKENKTTEEKDRASSEHKNDDKKETGFVAFLSKYKDHILACAVLGGGVGAAVGLAGAGIQKRKEDKQRRDEEKRQEEIEEQRGQEEIERVVKETEDKVRGKFEADLKSEQEQLVVTRQREDEDIKQQAKQRLDEIVAL